MYFTLGEYSRAEEAWERAKAGVGEDSSYLLGRRVALSTALGQPEEARRRLEALEERARRRYTPPTFMAIAYLGVGDQEKLFTALEAAMDEGSALPCIWATLPWSDPLRSDPRFQALLQKMNFPSQKGELP